MEGRHTVYFLNEAHWLDNAFLEQLFQDDLN